MGKGKGKSSRRGNAESRGRGGGGRRRGREAPEVSRCPARVEVLPARADDRLALVIVLVALARKRARGGMPSGMPIAALP